VGPALATQSGERESDLSLISLYWCRCFLPFHEAEERCKGSALATDLNLL
jgi:hypothetical protein